MDVTTKKWIEAAKLLEKDSTKIVKCPVCDKGILIVKDEEIPNHPDKFDRYLICNNCGNSNVITMKKG